MRSSNDPRGPRHDLDLGDAAGAVFGSFDSTLADWVQKASVAEASASRSRRHWLARQAEGEATLAGVIVDLGELGHPLALATPHTTVTGRVGGLGRDFVVIERSDGMATLVTLAAVSHVRSLQGVPVTGDRRLHLETTMAEILGPIAAERHEVTAWTGAGSVRGMLRGAGTDVLTLRLEDGTPLWLALADIEVLALG